MGKKVKGADELVAVPPPFIHGVLLHLGVYGEPHCGKTTFLADCAVGIWEQTGRPILVCSFDTVGKEVPWKRAIQQAGGRIKATKTNAAGLLQEDLVDAAGTHCLRIIHFKDTVYDQPKAAQAFLDLLHRLPKQIAEGKWGGFFVDSVSFASLLFRKYHEYDLNEGAKNPMQWYGGATDFLEETICQAIAAMQCHAGAIFHVSKTKVEAEGSMVRAPLAPGRLLNMIAATFPELYRIHVGYKEDGTKIRIMQTESDEKWIAGTVMEAPDGGAASWKRMWKGMGGLPAPATTNNQPSKKEKSV